MTLRHLDTWMRERATVPVLHLSRHEAQSISHMPLGLALRMTLEEAKEYSSLRGRVTLWARRYWGRTCRYDKKRDTFILELPKA